MEIISTLDDERERLKRVRELNYKLLKFNTVMKRPRSAADCPEYRGRVVKKLVG